MFEYILVTNMFHAGNSSLAETVSGVMVLKVRKEWVAQ